MFVRMGMAYIRLMQNVFGILSTYLNKKFRFLYRIIRPRCYAWITPSLVCYG